MMNHLGHTNGECVGSNVCCERIPTQPEREMHTYSHLFPPIFQVSHPYIVTLLGSFHTPTKLYLVMDFVNGGHLFFQLKKEGIFAEDLCRLYTAELVLALVHLHAADIVHRDLKPENILLDVEGHIRVTDFGLAKPIREGTRSNSFIGTMEYMAPEILKGKQFKFVRHS